MGIGSAESECCALVGSVPGCQNAHIKFLVQDVCEDIVAKKGSCGIVYCRKRCASHTN